MLKYVSQFGGQDNAGGSASREGYFSSPDADENGAQQFGWSKVHELLKPDDDAATSFSDRRWDGMSMEWIPAFPSWFVRLLGPSSPSDTPQ